MSFYSVKLPLGVAAVTERPEAYRRVDVTARDIADAVRHTDNNKTESERRQNVAPARFRAAPDKHRRAAAHKDENRRTDEFRKVFFYIFIPLYYFAFLTAVLTAIFDGE